MYDQEAETRIDFLQFLETDVSVHILSFVDDPADVVRASAVSRQWRQFVVSNGLAKHLCIRNFPQLSEIVKINEVNQEKMNLHTSEAGSAARWESLEREHKIYASLHRTITKAKVPPRDCIETAVSASSTDRMPDESIVNTLNPRDRFIRTASYWSSKGQSDPAVPETLVYKLKAGIWVITEVDIQPFEAFFQPGSPIYSAKSVRFRLGHLKPLSKTGGRQLENLPFDKPADDMFEWTYTSPEFPMNQVNNLQRFELPEAILCVEGYLQIELLGRVQTQEMDGLYYTCVCYVRALGRSLSPAFNVEVLQPYGFKRLVLRYDPEYLVPLLECSSREDLIRLGQVEDDSRLFDRLGLLENLLRGFREEIDDEDD